MNTEPEPLAAILAEMRGNEFDDPHLDADGIIGARRLARDWADRIEAAYKREHAEWHAETDAAKEDRNRVACRMRHEFAEKCRNCPERAPGNAAATREALESAHRTLKLVCEHAGEFVQPRLAEEIIHTGAAVERALSAPARNCDRFATVGAAHKAWRATDQERDFADWLFATAEGGEK